MNSSRPIHISAGQLDACQEHFAAYEPVDDTVVLLRLLQALLCVLLGYRGRYGAGGQAELKSQMEAVSQKIRRIRKDSGLLSPDWAPPSGTLEAAGPDPWFRPMLIAASVCLLLVLLLFAGFKLSLGSGASDLQSTLSETGK